MKTTLTFSLLPVLAVVISVLSWYVPKFKEWFAALLEQQKQLFMVGIIVIVDLAVVGLSLLGFLDVYVGPTWREWVWYPLVDITIAVISNAGVYKATNYLLGGKDQG